MIKAGGQPIRHFYPERPLLQQAKSLDSYQQGFPGSRAALDSITETTHYFIFTRWSKIVFFPHCHAAWPGLHKKKDAQKKEKKEQHKWIFTCDRLHLYNRTQIFARPPQSHQKSTQENDKILNSHLKNKIKQKTIWLFVTTSAPRAAFRHTWGMRLSIHRPVCPPPPPPEDPTWRKSASFDSQWLVCVRADEPAEKTPLKCAPLHNICLVTIFYLFILFCLPQHGARSRSLRFLPNPTCEIQK